MIIYYWCLFKNPKCNFQLPVNENGSLDLRIKTDLVPNKGGLQVLIVNDFGKHFAHYKFFHLNSNRPNILSLLVNLIFKIVGTYISITLEQHWTLEQHIVYRSSFKIICLTTILCLRKYLTQSHNISRKSGILESLFLYYVVYNFWST